MPTLLQITGTTIAELENELATLKAQAPGATPHAPPSRATPAPVPSPQLPQQLQQLKAQSRSTTGQTWKMVHEIATHIPGQFGLDDVRRHLGVRLRDVRAWRRNIGRWSKRTGVVIFQHVPGSHHPTQYQMPADVRQEVLRVGP